MSGLQFVEFVLSPCFLCKYTLSKMKLTYCKCRYLKRVNVRFNEHVLLILRREKLNDRTSDVQLQCLFGTEPDWSQGREMICYQMNNFYTQIT